MSDADRHGYKKVMKRTVDTDVVGLAISLMPQINLDQSWVAFGT